MATLELLPPYTLDDVKKAYKAKARGVHPDAGGKASEFVELTEAYKRALEYVEFRSSAREWIAARIERYIEQNELIEELQSAGGSVELEEGAWRQRVLGEFGQVGDQIVAVRLNAMANVSACLKSLVQRRQLLDKLLLIDLGNSAVTDTEIGQLSAFPQLRRLDLRNARLSYRSLSVLGKFNDLTMLNLGGTRINRWQRFRLSRRFPQLRVVMHDDRALDTLPSQANMLAGGH
jgi:hypothetical protein